MNSSRLNFKVVMFALIAACLSACETETKINANQNLHIESGIVDSVRTIVSKQGHGYGGAIIGGVAGSAIGTQFGKGNGRKLSVATGAVVGAAVGDAIADARSTTTTSEIVVRISATRSITVMQPRNFHESFFKGQNVQVVFSDGEARVEGIAAASFR